MPNRTARLALACVPLLFAVPILYALGASLVDVAGTPHPFFGDISGTSADAHSIALGVPLYQDPAAGYTPLTYTPFMSVLGAGLDLIAEWEGWEMILTILANIALVALAAILAFRSLGGKLYDRAAALAAALGIGALAFWLVAFVPFNSLYSPRPDQLSWAFALVGLTLVPAGARGSRAAGIVAVSLLTLGWWTKQPALLAPVAACAWLAIVAVRERAARRASVAMIGAIVLVGVASFGLADLLTDGWSTTFVVDMPGDRATPVSLGDSIHDLITSVAPAAIIAMVFWLAAWSGGEREGPSGSWLLGRYETAWVGARDIAGVFLVFLVFDVPAALDFRLAVGSTQSQFVGIAWALALLAALGWGLCQRGRLGAVVAAAASVVALFVVSEVSGIGRWLHDAEVVVPPKDLRALAFNQPAALLSYSRDHLVYHPGYAGIGVDREDELYPNQFNVNGLNRSGHSAGYLERALLDRRFDLIYPFSGNGDPGPWEANYFWKLNQVIDAKYESSSTLPAGLEQARAVPYPFHPFVAGSPLVRRPGPDPAPWMAHCFAPFEIDGTSWRIGAGGGFWCRPGGRGSVLQLIATPAPASEIRADDYEASAAGSILITAPRAGTVALQLGDRTVRAAVGPRTPLDIPVPAGTHGIRILASAASRARVELGGLSG